MSERNKSYFTVEELCYSAKAVVNKVSNVPTAKERKNIELLIANILDPLRKAMGKPIKVNSGFRNAKTNKLVGGVSTSAHLSGYAADIVCPSYGNAKEFCKYVEKFLVDNNIAFDQLIHEYDSWVHIGIKHNDGRQRKQVITINKNGTFPGIR